MKKTLIAAAFVMTAQLSVSTAGLAADDAVNSPAHMGQMLYDSSGHRVASVNRVTPKGDAQIILNGRLITVSASTLSLTNGKLTTSLSKSDIGKGS